MKTVEKVGYVLLGIGVVLFALCSRHPSMIPVSLGLTLLGNVLAIVGYFGIDHATYEEEAWGADSEEEAGG